MTSTTSIPHVFHWKFTHEDLCHISRPYRTFSIADFTVSFNEKKYKLILDNVVDQDDISSLSSRILPLNDSRINEELRALRGCTNKYQLRQFLSLKRFAEWFIDSIIQEVEVCLWSDYEEETTEENEEEVKEMTYEEYEILEGIQVGNVVELNSDIFEEGNSGIPRRKTF